MTNVDTLQYKRCPACVGSGTMLGGGMMQVECDNCKGAKKIPDIKSSPSYKEAIDKIKKSNKNLTTAEAEKVFDDEYRKQ